MDAQTVVTACSSCECKNKPEKGDPQIHCRRFRVITRCSHYVGPYPDRHIKVWGGPEYRASLRPPKKEKPCPTKKRKKNPSP